MAATRVYILAKELGVKSTAILQKCQDEGLDIKNHMSVISAGLAATIREWFSEGENITTQAKEKIMIMNNRSDCLMTGILRPGKKAEKWAVALGWWIPRKYRGPIVGDILEDCHEMRDKSYGEWRIRIHVIWQWVIAVGTLIPAVVVGSIWCKLNPPK